MKAQSQQKGNFHSAVRAQASSMQSMMLILFNVGAFDIEHRPFRIRSPADYALERLSHKMTKKEMNNSSTAEYAPLYATHSARSTSLLLLFCFFIIIPLYYYYPLYLDIRWYTPSWQYSHDPRPAFFNPDLCRSLTRKPCNSQNT
jgi:hypothetical protein